MEITARERWAIVHISRSESQTSMSNKIIDTQGAEMPFFAHLLTGQDQADGPKPKPLPTYHCLDSPCTKKYPSDDDEPTSITWDK